MIRLLTIFTLLFCVRVVIAAERNLDPVELKLISSHSKVAPGEIFKIGVFFKIDPGWHVYWKYPGEAGLPTVPNFILPAGYTIGEIHWPLPDRFVQGPNLSGFGYSDELLLTADATVPLNVSPGEFQLSAKVRWLSCSDVCVPGRKEISLPINVGERLTGPDKELFESWSSRLPALESESTNLFEKSLPVISEQPDGITVEVEIRWHASVEDIDWYPAPQPPAEVRNPKILTLQNISKVTFDIFHPRGEKELTAIDSLLVFKSAGKRVGVSVPIMFNFN